MEQIDEEERPTVRKRLAGGLGFKGISILHRFFPLYGFDGTTDFVIDMQHGLPLNPVKHEFEAILSMLDKNSFNDGCSDDDDQVTRRNCKVIEERLLSMPWTSGMIWHKIGMLVGINCLVAARISGFTLSKKSEPYWILEK